MSTHTPRLEPGRGSEILIEARRLGAVLRVAAVDAATGAEAVAIGPAGDPGAVERLAVAKLRRMLAAQRGGNGVA
ncbi:MAG: hypothetical protein IT557_19760 [Alphaproteobacteria bacterium]|nr:hypothetical protein [Alphaproteobacteria bacterium]